MEFKYIRIQGKELSYTTKKPKGIFAMCWRMIYDGIVAEEDAAQFKSMDCWFKENLPEPGVCKNGQNVITYFKTETYGEMLEKLKPAFDLLDKYHQPYDVVYTNYVENIVYEDQWQVAAY